MKKLLATALLVFSAWAWAQDDLGPKGPLVTMGPMQTVTAVQGNPSTISLLFRVASGYHINSNQPKA